MIIAAGGITPIIIHSFCKDQFGVTGMKDDAYDVEYFRVKEAPAILIENMNDDVNVVTTNQGTNKY